MWTSGRPAARRDPPSRHADGGQDSFTRGHDRADVALVDGDQLVVLADEPRGPIVLQHVRASGAEAVVGDVQPADADPLARGAPRVGVAVLVDVDEDHVELAVDAAERLERVAEVPPDPIADAGPVEERPTGLDVRRVAVGALDLAALADRAREPVRAVAEPRAQLEHAPGADRPREQLER